MMLFVGENTNKGTKSLIKVYTLQTSKNSATGFDTNYKINLVTL